MDDNIIKLLMEFKNQLAEEVLEKDSIIYMNHKLTNILHDYRNLVNLFRDLDEKQLDLKVPKDIIQKVNYVEKNINELYKYFKKRLD